MELSDVAKREIKIHMDIELGRNLLSDVAKREIKIYMDIELGRQYKPSKPISLWPYNTTYDF